SSKDFREFKVLDSKYIDPDEVWQPFENVLKDFTQDYHDKLKSMILEQDIPTIQTHINSGSLSYLDLTRFYLFRIKKFDRENEQSLNSVISVNPDVIEQARERDRELKNKMAKHPIFGMPILLKDNINASSMATTAGAVAMMDNFTQDAFIVERLKENGALILGKTNLSEWAYFFCGDCPSGYSAVGGQTLNPYGRRIIDTGGSSSGSGVAVAANFCAAAIGSETSGSILSPSSQNSIVGLKPTVGLISRSGIVPISSTLDTTGPMTKNVTDNAILLDAIYGYDKNDMASFATEIQPFYKLGTGNKLKGMRFGAVKRLMEDSLYVNAIEVLKSKGAKIIEIEEEEIELPGFRRLLNLDMRKDLPKYLENYAGNLITVGSVQDIIEFNDTDSLNIAPYGQKLFKGIVADKGNLKDLRRIIDTLSRNGKTYFEIPMQEENLDGFLSINNYHAGFAAVAKYPALTVPMGYDDKGVPKGLTFIGKPHSEKFLIEWAKDYEQFSSERKFPDLYN
ncbi:MAG: amidase, partial [Flavobacteriaceae bacterium]